jgi:hypothetical protein
MAGVWVGLDKGEIHVPGPMGQDGMKFHSTSQNGVKIWNFHWIFLDH